MKHTNWLIIKVKHHPSDIYGKNVSIMKINNIILIFHTCIILSSFVICFSCIYHSGSFPIVVENSKVICNLVCSLTVTLLNLHDGLLKK